MVSRKILFVCGFVVLTVAYGAFRGAQNGHVWRADGSDPLPKPKPPVLMADGSDPLPKPKPPVLVADGSDPLPKPKPPVAA